MSRVMLLILSISAFMVFVVDGNAIGQQWNYSDFSSMGKQVAGQYKEVGGSYTGQWAWMSSSGDDKSRIQWGDAGLGWPPDTYEQFSRSSSGEWVLLEGYGSVGSGEFLHQVVTSEKIGDVNCRNMTNLPTENGKQHYAKWTVSSVAYCLEAAGIMVYQGQVIDWYHKQVWFPPSGPTCSNSFYSGQICIKQYEIWKDNNGSPGGPLVVKHHRDNIFAKGLGPAFIIHNWDNGWKAHGSAYWDWSA